MQKWEGKGHEGGRRRQGKGQRKRREGEKSLEFRRFLPANCPTSVEKRDKRGKWGLRMAENGCIYKTKYGIQPSPGGGQIPGPSSSPKPSGKGKEEGGSYED